MTPCVLHTRATLCPLVAPRGAHSGCCVLQEVLFQTANVVLLCCFTVEMLVKVIALGPRNYWADNWNKLDGSTVVTSWIGEMVEGIGGVQALGCSASMSLKTRKGRKSQMFIEASPKI